MSFVEAAMVDPLCVQDPDGIPPGIPEAVQSIAHLPGEVVDPIVQAPAPLVGNRIPDHGWEYRQAGRHSRMQIMRSASLRFIGGPSS
jgi:hypothetical protein